MLTKSTYFPGIILQMFYFNNFNYNVFSVVQVCVCVHNKNYHDKTQFAIVYQQIILSFNWISESILWLDTFRKQTKAKANNNKNVNYKRLLVTPKKKLNGSYIKKLDDEKISCDQ